MKKYADKTSDERAIKRWENEGGEVVEIESLNKKEAAIEKRQNKSGESQHTDEVSDNSFEAESFQKKSDYAA